MRDSPRSPTAKTNGSRFEGNRIINPHSPDSKVNKQTNKQTRQIKTHRHKPGMENIERRHSDTLDLVWFDLILRH